MMWASWDFPGKIHWRQEHFFRGKTMVNFSRSYSANRRTVGDKNLMDEIIGYSVIRFFGTLLFRAVIGMLMVMFLLPGCQSKKAIQMPPVPVVVTQAIIQSTPLSLTSVGIVEPIESVSIKAQVGGVITQIGFNEGQDVRAGELLFQIDRRPFKAALDAALAQFTMDSTQAANAEIQARRYSDLVKKDFVTQEQYDAIRTQSEVLRSNVRAGKAAVEQAKLNLGYATIAAPISGRTGSILAKKGNVVKANDLPLVVINQLRPIRVSFVIPEGQLPLVQKFSAQRKLDVNVKPSRNDNDANVLKGQLTFIDNAVDRNTGTITLKAEFPNDNGSLWPGQFVNTELILTVESAALTIPAIAVVTGQDGTFAFVIGDDKKAEKRPIVVNRTSNSVAVVDDGLKAGDVVVTDGQMRLVPGSVVMIQSGLAEQGRKP
jgi:membrane fusion protein, multidrug efflux system